MVSNAFVCGDGYDWEVWALGGHGHGGSARGGLADDHVSIDFFSEASGSGGNGAIDIAGARFFTRNGSDARVILGVENDFFHLFDGFDWVRTIGGFVGKHDDVSALDDSGGNVGNFGPGRLGRINHGREHLGGDDAEFAVGAAEGDELALDNRDDFGAGFDRHVAAGNHDAVGSFNDGLEVFVGGDGFFGFDFGDDFGGAAVGK